MNEAVTVLEPQFHESMEEIYQQAKRACGYNATRFLQMVRQFGGVATAKRLLLSTGYSTGLTELWECGRLDLSVEALVLQDRWASIFTDEERAIARSRLTELHYDPQADHRV